MQQNDWRAFPVLSIPNFDMINGYIALSIAAMVANPILTKLIMAAALALSVNAFDATYDPPANKSLVFVILVLLSNHIECSISELA